MFGESDMYLERGYSYTLRSKTYNAQIYLINAANFKKQCKDLLRDETRLLRYLHQVDKQFVNKMAVSIHRYQEQTKMKVPVRREFDESKDLVKIDQLKEVQRFTGQSV